MLLANYEAITREKETKEEQHREHFMDELGFTGTVMTKEKSERLEARVKQELNEVEEKNLVFNQCLEEENKLITNMGKSFVDKIKYIRTVASRDIPRGSDPRIHYFLQCRRDLDVVLPILEKVFKKTLVLQEYTLSQGHCRGLAAACQFFDHRFVNRVFFNNCGIDDQEFADILSGLSTLKDFKAISYRLNSFNELSLRALEPLLKKRLPNHL